MSLQLSKLLQNPSSLPFASLTNLVDLSSTAGEMFLVAPEDIKSEVYIFDTRGEEETTLQSDITDNWAEDNTSIQDHIGLKPRTITLTGYVGELTNKPAFQSKTLQRAENTLQGLAPFTPQLTSSALYAVNRAQEVYGIYQKANETVGRLEDFLSQIPVPDVTNQQKIFGKFEQLWEGRRLVTVYTPFGAFNNMAIQSIKARQEEDSSYISSFSVTFKQIRTVNTIYTYQNTQKQRLARAAMTLANQKDKGVQKPASSSLDSIYQKATGATPNRP